ncbi:NTP transferase domain-containing protein [Streptomyces sp. NPDC050535]|uniref:NTP transferase domain-containing protein n=1 Tax=Streptomyces sp. NPDC050535 TaxID=3365626 RepID=UPI0037A67DFC
MNAYEAPGDPGAPLPYDAVVLAGGAARRLGGVDKPAVRVGGRALLDRVLTACADAATTVVVADPRPTARPVLWAREDPPGGGPLAALDAGLRHTTAEYVVVLSADLPFLTAGTVGRLVEALRASGTGPVDAGGKPGVAGPVDAGRKPGVADTWDAGEKSGAIEPAGTEGKQTGPDGVLLVDPEGRDQPLVAAYRVRSLRRELDAFTADTSTGDSAAGRTLAGLPLRKLTAALDLIRISDPVASFDCDTWDDIAAARARIREHGHVLDEWISAVKDELGIDLDVDISVLLDLARDAAHGVARPAAPLTTFLVGYAAARAGGGPEAVAEAARKAAALALRWADEEAAEAKPETGPADGTGAGPVSGPDAG